MIKKGKGGSLVNSKKNSVNKFGTVGYGRNKEKEKEKEKIYIYIYKLDLILDWPCDWHGLELGQAILTAFYDVEIGLLMEDLISDLFA